MNELSLNILDIVENSISAGASIIEIEIYEDTVSDILKINIIDNGCGIPKDKIKHVLDPFYTSRKTRRVGLGLPLIKQVANDCGGDIKIESEKGHTCVSIWMKYSHIDRPPIGNITDTIITILVSNNNIDLIYKHYYNDKNFSFSTIDLKKVLGEQVPLNIPIVIEFIKKEINEGLANLYGGVRKL
ncbi:ATP-binding protein [Caldicellulosiruptoraceae bacterium PP1]